MKYKDRSKQLSGKNKNKHKNKSKQFAGKKNENGINPKLLDNNKTNLNDLQQVNKDKDDREKLQQAINDDQKRHNIGTKLFFLYDVNRNNTMASNDNLIELIGDTDLIVCAIKNLLKKNSTTTNNTDKDQKLPDNLKWSDIEELSKSIMEESFKWTSIKCFNKKESNNKNRLIGILNFQDKIVQECIRIILKAIYEPLFQTIDCSHAFRPKRSVNTCLKRIQETGKGMTTAIKSDIKKAYDNIDKEILIEILKEKIKDKKMISLIETGLNCGLIIENQIKYTDLGLPQGGITSPILFNIYMHKFDEFVVNHLGGLVNQLNINEKREESPRTKASLHWKNFKRRSDYKMKRLMLYPQRRGIRRYGNSLEREKYITLKKNFIVEKKKLIFAKDISQVKKKLMISYNRYGDDFLILTNANMPLAKKLKERINDWLKRNLKLFMAEEKSLVACLKKDRVKFLGFTIYDIEQRKMITTKAHIKKKLNVGIRIGIDMERRISKLKEEQILDFKNKPSHVNKLLILNTEQIIEKYNQKLRGLVSFYFENITMKSVGLKYLIYILNESCIKTLAKKLNRSRHELRIKYGSPLNIQYTNRYTGQIHDVSLYTYKELMEWGQKITEKSLAKYNLERKLLKRFPNPILLDSLDLLQSNNFSYNEFQVEKKFNLRSKGILLSHCCICGVKHSIETPIEAHHLKHVRKNKSIGFNQIQSQLNRKTIPVCKNCHNKIHNGRYSSKRLKDLVNPSLL